MKRKEVLLYVRSSGYLKGLKPAIIYLKTNQGKIYNGGFKYFVMSLKNDKLYFQSLSRWFNKLDKKFDFEINVDEIIRYQHITSNRMFNVLVIYLKDRKFLDIYYDKGIRDTFVIEDNIQRTIKCFEEKNIKELVMEEKDEKSNTEREKSD